MRRSLVALLVVMAFMMSACAAPRTKGEQGVAVGAGVGPATGAVLGQAIGRNTESTLLGAAAGAVVGGVVGGSIGNYMDQQERELHQRFTRVEGARVERQENNIFITFKADLLFDVDSSTLKPGAYDEVDAVANILRRYPETRVRVLGHTDSTGSEKYNMELSERRADAVKESLVRAGVVPGRVTARGIGETKPLASNATESGRQMNRRVTIEILPARS